MITIMGRVDPYSSSLMKRDPNQSWEHWYKAVVVVGVPKAWWMRTLTLPISGRGTLLDTKGYNKHYRYSTAGGGWCGKSDESKPYCCPEGELAMTEWPHRGHDCGGGGGGYEDLCMIRPLSLPGPVVSYYQGFPC